MSAVLVTCSEHLWSCSYKGACRLAQGPAPHHLIQLLHQLHQLWVIDGSLALAAGPLPLLLPLLLPLHGRCKAVLLTSAAALQGTVSNQVSRCSCVHDLVKLLLACVSGVRLTLVVPLLRAALRDMCLPGSDLH